MPWVCEIDHLEDMLDENAPPRACRRITDAATGRMVDHTKANTPIGADPFRDRGARAPGTARASIQRGPIRKRLRGGRDRYEVSVFSDDPVFPFIEWNTKPHIIRPRIDRAAATVLETRRPRGTVQDGRAALSWRGPGGRIFASVVHHPGTTGQHPFALGALLTEAEMAAIAAEPLAQFRSELLAPTRRLLMLARFT